MSKPEHGGRPVIGRSQRQLDRQQHSRDWTVHTVLARARDRNRHLLQASVLALLAALAGWLLGLDLAMRAGLVAVAAALAWLIPLRGSNEWALNWIGERAGLSYQTALEMDDDDDPYGLRAAVEARADASLAYVKRPEHSAWWLPLLALAVGALLLPALPLGGSGGLAGGPFPPGSATPAPVDASAEEEGEESPPNLPGEERTRVARSPEAARPGAERGEEGDGAGEGQAGEREALERYLRSIRESPEALADEQDPGEEGNNAAPSGPAPGEGAQERQGGAGERGTQQDRSGEGEGEQSGEQGGAEGQQQGRAGEEGAGREEQNPFAPAGSSENQEQGEGGDAGESPGAEDGRPGEEQLQEGGEQASGAGDAPEAGEQQGQGQGAGGLPSAEQEAGRAGQLGEETLQLRGDLREGPLNSGGTIQLPGGDEVELPPGRSAETYAREVESAVTEGRIPLEYQEIIRNYFR